MSTLYTILTVLVIIASVLITLIVLLQNGKGGGLASNFVAGNQTFGVRQTADILEKITWGLVVFIFTVSIVSSFVKGDKNDGEDRAAFKAKFEGKKGESDNNTLNFSDGEQSLKTEEETPAQN